MIHLHDLIGSSSKDLRAPAPNELSEELCWDAFKFAKTLGPQAVCFDLGEAGKLAGMKWQAEGLRLPYPVCWFEFQHDGSCTGVLIAENQGYFKLASFCKQKGLWYLDWVGETTALGEKTSCAPTDDVTAALCADTVCGIAVFLTALQCVNVRQRVHSPDAKLQKAREKRGKPPLFSFWTLELNGRTESGAPQGGTHASPRVHLRRGHPRQYAPGKWTWVQPCAVGNRVDGMVHKDYAAGPALLSTAQ